MLLYSQDAIVFGLGGEVNLYLDISGGKMTIRSRKSSDNDDVWRNDYRFSEEDTRKVLTLLSAETEEEAGVKLKTEFCPEDNTPGDGYDNTDIMGRFVSAFLSYFGENGIHYTDEEYIRFDDTGEEQRMTYRF